MSAAPAGGGEPALQARLPRGVRSRHVDTATGLRMHLLEAGHERPGCPVVLLLHGFPELAWSWRKLLLPLAEAGYHVLAPDQRGYGGTTGWDRRYDGDLAAFGMLPLATDLLALLRALDIGSVAAVVGHDFGSPVAAWCAVARPDVFRSAVLMSAPFDGTPDLTAGATAPAGPDIHAALAALPRPRKHYQWYYGTREADRDMRDCPQGLHAFLRAYYHVKSADWPGNRPVRLDGWSAEQLARLPTYYVMDRDQTMAETVAPYMPDPAAVAACAWLTEDELSVYRDSFARTGFQGGLQWYRCRTDPRHSAELRLFAGRTLDVPCLFVAGDADWGVYQKPGALEAMQQRACTRLLGTHLIPGAGHWVQQEQPEAAAGLLLDFLARVSSAR